MNKPMSKAAATLALAVAPFIATAAHADEQGGPYIGVSAGYGWSDADTTTSTVFSPTGYFADTSVPAINATGIQKVKPKAFNGGIDIGYDYRAGNILFGVAADISTLNNTKTASTTTTYPCCSPSAFTVTQTVKTRWMTTARARLGYDFGGGAIYATGGWAGMKLRYTGTFTDDFATALETASASKFRSGWTAGGGADIRFGNGWSLQPEYLHADFGTMTVPGGTLTAFTPSQSFPENTFSHSVKLRTNIVRVGMHYHF